MTKKITLVFVLFLFVFGLRAESLLNEDELSDRRLDCN